MDKEKKLVPDEKQSSVPLKPEDTSDSSWVDEMKQEMEDYVEEQGIYIRQ